VRALALGDNVIVFISQYCQTSSTAVRSDEEGFVIDSPVYPEELDALPAVLEQAGFPVSGLLTTHADWDHLLGRLAFPQASLGCAESTAGRLRAEPGAAQRELRQFDEEQYVERARPLGLADVQALPAPGRLSLGPDDELELQPTSGHTADGMAVVIPGAGVLVCGDYLSPVEIPCICAGGSLDAYVATLARLRPMVEHAERIVPGHGVPVDRDRALRLLEEDLRYLSDLRRDGAGAPLPKGRATGVQQRIHRENVQRIGLSRSQ
jgi:glyoxylase-like metal-dependent hydrolase (beta-lactamase superfamily II)